jgi:hypothetical protein
MQPSKTVKKEEALPELKPASKPAPTNMKVPLQNDTPQKTPTFDKQKRPTLNMGRVKAL